MPAIDNTLVRQQAAELAALYEAPQQFVKPLRVILEQHADPSLRQSLVVSIRTPLNGYGTPKPVLKTILNHLRKQLRVNPEPGIALAAQLWEGGSREERWLAGEILRLCASVASEQGWQLLESWLLDLTDYEMADALGLSAGVALLEIAPRERLDAVRAWVNAGQRWTRRFGLATLVGLARSGNFNDVATILDVIKPGMSEKDAEVRNGVAWLIRELTLVSSLDVVRFLREWAQSMNRHAHWIVRHSLDNLDGDARAEIQTLLRGSG